LPAKNWMSSISSASTCWNWRLNASMVLSCSAFIIALKNCSLRRYITRMPGALRRISLPAANIRWVLPRPVPPYSSSGLWARSPGFCAACHAAARPSWLLRPSTKLSKV